jgi:hypothetical protein
VAAHCQQQIAIAAIADRDVQLAAQSTGKEAQYERKQAQQALQRLSDLRYRKVASG